MELTVLLLMGFALGFLGSVPVAGPIALLILTLVIDGQHRRAVFIAIGAGVAEGGYAFLAFWGFSQYLARYEILIPISRGVAAIILTVIGIVLVRRRPAAGPPLKRSWPGGGLLLGFGITLLNPTLIATWTAVVSTLFATGLVSFSPAASLPFALSVAAGIFAWFFLVVMLGRRHLGRFQRATLDSVVRIMGGLALAAGAGFAAWTAAYFLG